MEPALLVPAGALWSGPIFSLPHHGHAWNRVENRKVDHESPYRSDHGPNRCDRCLDSRHVASTNHCIWLIPSFDADCIGADERSEFRPVKPPTRSKGDIVSSSQIGLRQTLLRFRSIGEIPRQRHDHAATTDQKRDGEDGKGPESHSVQDIYVFRLTDIVLRVDALLTPPACASRPLRARCGWPGGGGWPIRPVPRWAAAARLPSG